ncbi:hypothetical protein BDV11DRAFT_200453 [Aspergillus similis]
MCLVCNRLCMGRGGMGSPFVILHCMFGDKLYTSRALFHGVGYVQTEYLAGEHRLCAKEQSRENSYDHSLRPQDARDRAILISVLPSTTVSHIAWGLSFKDQWIDPRVSDRPLLMDCMPDPSERARMIQKFRTHNLEVGYRELGTKDSSMGVILSAHPISCFVGPAKNKIP